MRRALVAAVALMLIVPGLAPAKSPNVQRADDRAPSARVQTAGSGMMMVAGRLTVNGLIPERGIVVVKDRSGDARAHLAGVPLKLEQGERTRVRGASGILYVTGSSVSVRIIGEGLSFSVAGNGRALFVGSGTWVRNSEPEQEWSGEWIRIAPSSFAERRRDRQCANCSSSVAPRR